MNNLSLQHNIIVIDILAQLFHGQSLNGLEMMHMLCSTFFYSYLQNTFNCNRSI